MLANINIWFLFNNTQLEYLNLSYNNLTDLSQFSTSSIFLFLWKYTEKNKHSINIKIFIRIIDIIIYMGILLFLICFNQLLLFILNNNWQYFILFWIVVFFLMFIFLIAIMLIHAVFFFDKKETIRIPKFWPYSIKKFLYNMKIISKHQILWSWIKIELMCICICILMSILFFLSGLYL